MLKGFLTAPALAVLLTLAAPQAFAEDQRLLSVSGEATVQRAPDQGIVRFGVEARAKTAQTAMETVAGNMTAIFAALEGKGVLAKDMQSSGLSLYPIYPDRNSGGPVEAEGFGASLSLAVAIRDLTQAGAIIDTALLAGANRMDGLSFGLADPDPAMDEARALAVKKALARAQILADAAGITLGPVQRIRDIDHGQGRPMPMAEMSMKASVPVAPGELGISAGVEIEFLIE